MRLINYFRKFSLSIRLTFGWCDRIEHTSSCFSQVIYRHLLSSTSVVQWSQTFNKKVLLRERKRYTARRVVSTRYVVKVGCTPSPILPMGIAPSCWGRTVPPILTRNCGTPPCPDLRWEHPPVLTWDRGTPHPTLRWGTLPSWSGIGIPPIGRTAVPPPPKSGCGLTNWKQYLPPSLGCGR